MTSNESKANLIWDKLFSIKNENKSKDEQLSKICFACRNFAQKPQR